MGIPISRYYDLLKMFEEYEGRKPQTKIESEGKTMKHNVIITKEENRVIEEYWVIKAYRNLYPPTKELTVSKESKTEPTYQEIAQFLSDTDSKSAWVEHNYRFEPDLPFC